MKKNIITFILAILMLTLTVSCGKNVDNTVTTVKTGGHDNSHTVVIDKAVDATCTSEGKTEGKHCSSAVRSYRHKRLSLLSVTLIMTMTAIATGAEQILLHTHKGFISKATATALAM